VRGRWLREAPLVRLSGTAAATVQGAQAGGHGAHVGSGLGYSDLCLLTNLLHVLGDARESIMRGRWLRETPFVRLSGRAAATVQDAHAGGHGTHAGSGHR